MRNFFLIFLILFSCSENKPDNLMSEKQMVDFLFDINIVNSSRAYEETFKILHPDTQVVCQVKMSRASLSITDETDDDDETEEGAEAAEGTAENAPSTDKPEAGNEEAKSE